MILTNKFHSSARYESGVGHSKAGNCVVITIAAIYPMRVTRNRGRLKFTSFCNRVGSVQFATQNSQIFKSVSSDLGLAILRIQSNNNVCTPKSHCKTNLSHATKTEGPWKVYSTI